MLLTIYGSYSLRRTDMAADDSNTQQKEVQGDNALTLSFIHYEHITLDVNDHTDLEGERYWLMEKYAPSQKSGGERVYDLKLHGIESLIKRFLVLETTDDDAEPAFTLVATSRKHVAIAVKCISDGMNHTTDRKMGQVDGTELIATDYEGEYCDETLKEIAEKVGGKAKQWVEGQIVNVCRCEHGEEITLGYNKGLTGIRRNTSNRVEFYTRLLLIGNTRNTDPQRYGHSRLMLLGGQKYVELYTDEYGIHDCYEKEAFSGIFPRRTGTVSSVRSVDITDEDGSTFTIYYLRNDTLNLDPNDYELASETKRVSPQDGDLDGLGEMDDHYFEANYDSDTCEPETITIWPYDDGTQLPGGRLVLKAGDSYILWNVRMPGEYYPVAEEEFLTAVERYNTERWQDISVYKALTDHVWVEKSKADPYTGRRVRLESEEYFPATGYRDSRITKVTRKVNLLPQMDTEISDALQQGTLDKVNDSIGELKNYTRVKTEGAGFPDIIGSQDNTLSTGNNLSSARRSQTEHLSRKKNDRAKGKTTFEKGASFDLEDNETIDDKGNAELLSMVVRTLLRGPKFVGGLFGEGWRLWMEDVLPHFTADKLMVRRVMAVLEMLIEKVRSVGGQFRASAANGKIKMVEEQDGLYKITFKQDSTFMVHDPMRCATLTDGSLKSYWAEVVGVEGSSASAGMDGFGTSFPVPDDECVLMGNMENLLCQDLISISATEGGQLRMDVMDGMKAKNFTGCLRMRLGNLDGISDDWSPANNQPHGSDFYSDNAYLRGTFLLMMSEDVKAKFGIVEGRTTSVVTTPRSDFAAERGYLNNPASDDGLEEWNTEDGTVFFLAGNKWIWANNSVLAKKGNGTGMTVGDGRTVVRIRSKYVLQRRANLKSVPPFPMNGGGEKEAVLVHLFLFYRCTKTGTLRVEFLDVDKTGFANFNSLETEEELEVTDGYAQYTTSGLWSDTGDFKLSFTGDIYLYMLILSTSRVKSLTHRYKTPFEQSKRLVRISTAVFDKDEFSLEETGLMVTSKYPGLYAIDGDGNLKSFAGAGQDGAKARAANVFLEGIVTANGNFKILEDGSVETINEKFLDEVVVIPGRLDGTRQYNYETGEYEIASGFKIAAGCIGSVTTARSSGGGLVTYDNFFRAGGMDGYVMFGNDAISSPMDGVSTAVGRIVNTHPNTSGYYGFDQANYGLFINVNGSTKNHGICSDATLMSPTFINTRANFLTLSDGSYNVDFSQHNIILMYYNESGYNRTEVTLPNEASVARQFGLSSLPADFATVVTFRVRTGLKNITLKGVCNHNEDPTNHEMASGDSVTLLISKADGFRYQILNHLY